MLFSQTRIPIVVSWLGVVALSSILAGCDRSAAEVASLKAENERLRLEIAKLRQKSDVANDPGTVAGKPDVVLTMNELWKQRFADTNPFRVRQMFADKTLRVTGVLDEVSSEHLSLNGLDKTQSAKMAVILDRTFATRVQSGLGALEKGVTVTVQGKFLFDRMELNGATIVDPATGHPMTTQQMQALGQLGSEGVPVPPPQNQ